METQVIAIGEMDSVREETKKETQEETYLLKSSQKKTNKTEQCSI